MTNQAIEEIKVNGLQAFEEKSNDSSGELLEFIYQNDPIVNLLFNCFQGTKSESIRYGLVNLEVQGAKKLTEVLRERKIGVNDLNDDELYVLYAMACMPLSEIITHRYPCSEASNFIDIMEAAMNLGWRRIIEWKHDIKLRGNKLWDRVSPDFLRFIESKQK